MYRSLPTPKNTYAKIAALVCLLLGMALFAIASLNLVDYPALPQTLGIFSLTASVYIASAFLLRRYTFSVDQNPQGELGELDFCIVENKGKREKFDLAAYIASLSPDERKALAEMVSDNG